MLKFLLSIWTPRSVITLLAVAAIAGYGFVKEEPDAIIVSSLAAAVSGFFGAENPNKDQNS